MDLMYKTPSDDTIRKCIITKEAVEGTGEPEIVHGELRPAGESCKKSRTQNIPFAERKASRKQLDEGNDINDKSGQYIANDRSPWDYSPSGYDRTL